MGTKGTITAEKQSLCRVMEDLLSDLGLKKIVIVVTGLICFIVVALLFHFDFCKSCDISDRLFSANITMLGVDVAAIALLLALFSGVELEEKATEALRSQNIAFVANALLQLLAVVLFIFTFFFSCCIFNAIVAYIQITALVLVWDVIVELFALSSIIIKRKK